MSDEAKPQTVDGVSNQVMILQGILYTAIAMLTPAVAIVSGHDPFTPRMVIGLVITCLISGATALKAFLSTSFAGSGGKS